jgi:two-component system sensor histidine kinase AtoS
VIPRARFRSLRTQFLSGTVLVIVLVMAAVFVVVDHRQQAAIVGELQRRGEALARGLAATSQAPLLLYNFTALEQNVVRTASEADVLYAIILDADGVVAAHSRHPEEVGAVLAGAVARRALETGPILVQETRGVDDEAIYDVAVPVLVERTRWGTVRVGLSRRRMETELLTTRLELAGLALLTLVLGSAVAALVARRISGPVGRLAEGAAAIARGDLTQRIEPATDDEIGRLAAAFNHMSSELLHERTALEDANAELRRRLEEVADLKGYTDTVLASLPTGIVTVGLDGRVVTLNPAAELMTGFFSAEAAGRFCTEIFMATPGVGEILMETLTARSMSPPVSITLRRRNGRTLPVEFSAAPLRGEGKDLGVIGVFRDLSLVRELEHRLRRSDRLAGLGRLAAGLAHEIKTPLMSVLTFTRHLGRRFDDERFRERFQAVVPHELERINVIVERLLELARPARLTFAPVRLPALADRALALHANDLDARSIEVRREYASGLPTVWGDQEALYRVVVNLVANAVEAMPTGGQLTVRIAWADDHGALIAGRAASPRRIRLEVEDTGVGIAPSQAEQVFTPFFSTKPRGTGLGLALTHKLVQDHGGTIDFHTFRGVGTTFRIVLPLVPDVPAAPAGADDASR